MARKPSAVIPKRLIKGGYDDATSVFTPGRWERMPVGPPEKWWHELPLKWPELMPEWGAKVKQTFMRTKQKTIFNDIMFRREAR